MVACHSQSFSMISCFSGSSSFMAKIFSRLARIVDFRASSCWRMYRASSPFSLPSKSVPVLWNRTVIIGAIGAFLAAATARSAARGTPENLRIACIVLSEMTIETSRRQWTHQITTIIMKRSRNQSKSIALVNWVNDIIFIVADSSNDCLVN